MVLPARLVSFGYQYKIDVSIPDVVVSFEKDEERNWRAILSSLDTQHNKSVDKELIHGIVQTLEKEFSY